MVVLGWFVRILAIAGVSHGVATMAFQSRKMAKDIHTSGKLVALLVAFWCIVAMLGLMVLAETYTSVKPQWLATVLTGVECFLWAAIIIEFGFRHRN